MISDPVQNDNQLMLERALAGDESALASLFDGYRARLRPMIRLRLDRRLAGRVDSSDVLQEAYLDVGRRIAEYARDPAAMPFHLRELLALRHLEHLSFAPYRLTRARMAGLRRPDRGGLP